MASDSYNFHLFSPPTSSHLTFDTSIFNPSNNETFGNSAATNATNNRNRHDSSDSKPKISEISNASGNPIIVMNSNDETDSPNLNKRNLLNQIYSGVNLLNMNNQSLLATGSRSLSPNAYLHTNSFTPDSHISLSPLTSGNDDASIYRSDSDTINNLSDFYLLQNESQSIASSGLNLPDNNLLMNFLNHGGNDARFESLLENRTSVNELTSSNSAISSPLVFNTISKIPQSDTLNIESDNLSIATSVSPRNGSRPPDRLHDFNLDSIESEFLDNSGSSAILNDLITSDTSSKPHILNFNSCYNKPNVSDSAAGSAETKKAVEMNTFTFPVSNQAANKPKKTPLRLAIDSSSLKPQHSRDGSLCTLMGKASLMSPMSATCKKAPANLSLDIRATTKDFKTNDNLKTPVFQTSVLDFSTDAAEFKKKNHHKIQKSAVTKSSAHRLGNNHKKSQSLSSQSLTNLSNLSNLSMSRINGVSITTSNTPLATPIREGFPHPLRNLSHSNTDFTSLNIPNNFSTQKLQEHNNESFVSSMITGGDESSSEPDSVHNSEMKLNDTNYFFRNESAHSFGNDFSSKYNSFISTDNLLEETKDLVKLDMLSSDENDDWKSNPFDSTTSPAEVLENKHDQKTTDKKTINPSKLTSPISNSFNNFFKKSKSFDFKLNDELNRILPVSDESLPDGVQATNPNSSSSSLDDLKFDLYSTLNENESEDDSGDDLAPNYKALFHNVNGNGHKIIKTRKLKNANSMGTISAENVSTNAATNGHHRKNSTTTKTSFKEKLTRKKNLSVDVDAGKLQNKSSLSSMSASSIKEKLKSPILNKRNKQQQKSQEYPDQQAVQQTYSSFVNAARNRAASVNSSLDNLSSVTSLNGGSSIFSNNTAGGGASIYSAITNDTNGDEKLGRQSGLQPAFNNDRNPSFNKTIDSIIQSSRNDVNMHKKSLSLPINSVMPMAPTDMPSMLMSHSSTVHTQEQLAHSSQACLMDDAASKLAKQPTSRSRGRKPNLQYDPTKIFNCTLCSRKFKRQEHLKRHFRSLHTGEKPFGCNICGKKFSRSDNLRQHLKVHT